MPGKLLVYGLIYLRVTGRSLPRAVCSEFPIHSQKNRRRTTEDKVNDTATSVLSVSQNRTCFMISVSFCVTDVFWFRCVNNKDTALLRGYKSIDDLYHNILSHHADPTNQHLISTAQLMLAIRQVIQDAELFSMSVSLLALLDRPGTSASSSRNVTRRLLHVLAHNGNADNQDMVITDTFFSFLSNPSSSSPFSHLAVAHDQLATICLTILLDELQFDTCKFPSSFMRNQEVPDLSVRAGSAISSQLRYASQYWTDHVGRLTEMHREMVEQISVFFQTQFLHWLEVMSILNIPPAKALEKLLSSNVRYSLLEITGH